MIIDDDIGKLTALEKMLADIRNVGTAQPTPREQH